MIKMVEKEKNYNSQFLENCNTDWNLNHEFVCWLGYWFKEYKEKAEIKLNFHTFNYKGAILTQGEIIDRVIELCEKVHEDYYEEYEEEERDVDEIFDLFHLVFWTMWW